MNPFRKLTQPPYPNAAIGLDTGGASIVALERRGKGFRLRSAGYIDFPEGWVRPSFDDPNLTAAQELADALLELAATTGMNHQTRWSVSLPEATTRSTVLTIEGVPANNAELEEMLGWKIERAFNHPTGELRVARRRLSADERGRARYLVTGVHLSVLAEYEDVMRRLGWQAGLILPRYMGEAWWLIRNPTAAGDSLLVSSHEDGFTALISRGGEPLVVRNVLCDAEEAADELFRLLLFYRDRIVAPHGAGSSGEAREAHAASEAYNPDADTSRTIERVLIIGSGMDEATAHGVITDTLGTRPRLLRPEDFSLAMPTSEMRFDQIAAPAGLAALA